MCYLGFLAFKVLTVTAAWHSGKNSGHGVRGPILIPTFIYLFIYLFVCLFIYLFLMLELELNALYLVGRCSSTWAILLTQSQLFLHTACVT
jgi:hypothetical protein